MHIGSLYYNDLEIINVSRTYTYIKNMLPEIEVKVPVYSDAIFYGTGSTFSRPSFDEPPWKYAQSKNWNEFLGIIPTSISGLGDSQTTVAVTEMKGDGASLGARRNESREIRIRAAMVATTAAGLEYGIDWLSHEISGGYCTSWESPWHGGGLVYQRYPESGSYENLMKVRNEAKALYDVKTLQGVRVLEKLPFQTAHIREVEFILVAGNPFTYLEKPFASLSLSMPTGEWANEQKCDFELEAYEALITDPAAPVVVRPPRPSTPNEIDMPNRWRQHQSQIMTYQMRVAGQAVYRTVLSNVNRDIRNLRIRFISMQDAGYGTARACDAEGEFLITYLPQWSRLIFDGRTRQIMIQPPGGELVPAGNLVVGSYGRPAKWAETDCQAAMVVRVEHPTNISDLRVDVDAYYRR